MEHQRTPSRSKHTFVLSEPAVHPAPVFPAFIPIGDDDEVDLAWEGHAGSNEEASALQPPKQGLPVTEKVCQLPPPFIPALSDHTSRNSELAQQAFKRRRVEVNPSAVQPHSQHIAATTAANAPQQMQVPKQLPDAATAHQAGRSEPGSLTNSKLATGPASQVAVIGPSPGRPVAAQGSLPFSRQQEPVPFQLPAQQQLWRLSSAAAASGPSQPLQRPAAATLAHSTDAAAMSGSQLRNAAPKLSPHLTLGPGGPSMKPAQSAHAQKLAEIRELKFKLARLEQAMKADSAAKAGAAAKTTAAAKPAGRADQNSGIPAVRPRTAGAPRTNAGMPLEPVPKAVPNAALRGAAAAANSRAVPLASAASAGAVDVAEHEGSALVPMQLDVDTGATGPQLSGRAGAGAAVAQRDTQTCQSQAAASTLLPSNAQPCELASSTDSAIQPNVQQLQAPTAATEAENYSAGAKAALAAGVAGRDGEVQHCGGAKLGDLPVAAVTATSASDQEPHLKQQTGHAVQAVPGPASPAVQQPTVQQGNQPLSQHLGDQQGLVMQQAEAADGATCSGSAPAASVHPLAQSLAPGNPAAPPSSSPQPPSASSSQRARASGEPAEEQENLAAAEAFLGMLLPQLPGPHADDELYDQAQHALDASWSARRQGGVVEEQQQQQQMGSGDDQHGDASDGEMSDSVDIMSISSASRSSLSDSDDAEQPLGPPAVPVASPAIPDQQPAQQRAGAQAPTAGGFIGVCATSPSATANVLHAPVSAPVSAPRLPASSAQPADAPGHVGRLSGSHLASNSLGWSPPRPQQHGQQFAERPLHAGEAQQPDQAEAHHQHMQQLEELHQLRCRDMDSRAGGKRAPAVSLHTSRGTGSLKSHHHIGREARAGSLASLRRSGAGAGQHTVSHMPTSAASPELASSQSPSSRPDAAYQPPSALQPVTAPSAAVTSPASDAAQAAAVAAHRQHLQRLEDLRRQRVAQGRNPDLQSPLSQPTGPAMAIKPHAAPACQQAVSLEPRELPIGPVRSIAGTTAPPGTQLETSGAPNGPTSHPAQLSSPAPEDKGQHSAVVSQGRRPDPQAPQCTPAAGSEDRNDGMPQAERAAGSTPNGVYELLRLQEPLPMAGLRPLLPPLDFERSFELGTVVAWLGNFVANSSTDPLRLPMDRLSVRQQTLVAIAANIFGLMVRKQSSNRLNIHRTPATRALPPDSLALASLLAEFGPDGSRGDLEAVKAAIMAGAPNNQEADAIAVGLLAPHEKGYNTSRIRRVTRQLAVQGARFNGLVAAGQMPPVAAISCTADDQSAPPGHPEDGQHVMPNAARAVLQGAQPPGSKVPRQRAPPGPVQQSKKGAAKKPAKQPAAPKQGNKRKKRRVSLVDTPRQQAPDMQATEQAAELAASKRKVERVDKPARAGPHPVSYTLDVTAGGKAYDVVEVAEWAYRGLIDPLVKGMRVANVPTKCKPQVMQLAVLWGMTASTPCNNVIEITKLQPTAKPDVDALVARAGSLRDLTLADKRCLLQMFASFGSSWAAAQVGAAAGRGRPTGPVRARQDPSRGKAERMARSNLASGRHTSSLPLHLTGQRLVGLHGAGSQHPPPPLAMSSLQQGAFSIPSELERGPGQDPAGIPEHSMYPGSAAVPTLLLLGQRLDVAFQGGDADPCRAPLEASFNTSAEFDSRPGSPAEPAAPSADRPSAHGHADQPEGHSPAGEKSSRAQQPASHARSPSAEREEYSSPAHSPRDVGHYFRYSPETGGHAQIGDVGPQYYASSTGQHQAALPNMAAFGHMAAGALPAMQFQDPCYAALGFQASLGPVGVPGQLGAASFSWPGGGNLQYDAVGQVMQAMIQPVLGGFMPPHAAQGCWAGMPAGYAAHTAASSMQAQVAAQQWQGMTAPAQRAQRGAATTSRKAKQKARTHGHRRSVR